MKIADLFIKLGLKSDQYNKGIDSAKKKTNTFTNGLKKIGGIIAGAFAVSAIRNFTTEAIRLYNIQAQAEQQLLIALKGREDAQRDLIRQAQDLQRVTLFGDEETIRAQALIAAFVKEKEQIKEIIPLVQDLATAKGMQLSAAADLVSKTLGSSTNALSRYGIQVEGAVGSVERLKSLQEGLNNAFGGQAAAAAQTGAGALIQLQNAMGDLKEAVGQLIVEGGKFNSFIKGSITEIQQWTSILSDESRSGFGKFLLFLTGSRQKWAEVAAEIDENIRKQEKLNAVLDGYSEMYKKAQGPIKETTEVVQQHEQTVGDLKNKISELKASIDDYGISQEAEIQKTLREISAAEKLIERLTTLATVRKQVEPGAMMATRSETPQIGSGITPMPEGLADMTGFLKKNAEMTKKYTDEMMADWNNFSQNLGFLIEDEIVDFIDEFARSLGQLASGSINMKGFFNNILSQLGKFLGQIGKLMMAFGVAQLAFGTSLKNIFNPASAPVLIAAGAALVAISGAIGGMASKAAATGGATGSAGGFSVSSRAFMPFDGRDKSNVEISGVLMGDNILLSNNRANYRRGVIG